MACCAFAAFLLVTLLAPFGAMRRYLFGDRPVENAAAAWRAGGTMGGETIVGWRHRSRAAVSFFLAAEIALAAGVGVYLMLPDRSVTEDGWDALVAHHTRWCSRESVGPTLELAEYSR